MSFQRGILFTEPSRAIATVLYSVLSVAAIAALTAGLLIREDHWPVGLPRPQFPVPDGAIVALAALAVLLVSATVVNGRRWRTERQMLRLLEDPDLITAIPPGQVVTAGPFVRPAPPLDVSVVRPPRFRRRPGPLRRVSTTHNVLGRPPMSILYLRVFENQPRARTFVRGAWREFGHVYLLRSPAAISPVQFRAAKRAGRLGSLFVSSPQALSALLDRAPTEALSPGFRSLDTVAGSTVWTFDRYGAYPVTSVFCHSSFWQRALDHLLSRADLVVLDLSGYRTRNHGTQYEIQRIVDTFPISRVLFLADPWSNTRYLQRQIHAAWDRMSVHSPNAGCEPRSVPLALTDYYMEIQAQPPTAAGPGQTRTVLKSSRAQSRWLLAQAQERLTGLPVHAGGLTTSLSGPPAPPGPSWTPDDVQEEAGTHVARRGALAALVLLVVAAGAFLAWDPAGLLGPAGTRASVASTFEIREGPSRDHPSLGQVHPGDEIVVECLTPNRWARLERPTPGGFVATDEMEFAEGREPPPC